MFKLDLRNKACSVVCSILLWPVALTWTQTDSSSTSKKSNIEIFTEGKRFESLDEYRRYQEISDPVLSKTEVPPVSLMPKTAKEMIIYMENLSDDDLRQLIKELRSRRADLFTNDSLDFYINEMQNMLEEANTTGALADVKLDPSKMKMIAISDQSREQPSLKEVSKSLFITKDDIHSMRERDIEQLTEAIKEREDAPLGEKLEFNRTAEVRAVYVEGEDSTKLISETQAQMVLGMLSNAQTGKEGEGQVVQGEDLKRMLREVQRQSRQPIPTQSTLDPGLLGMTSLFLNRGPPKYQPLPILLYPDETKALSKFLKDPKGLSKGGSFAASVVTAEHILRELPDDELKQVLAIYNERRRRRKKAAQNRDFKGVPVEGALKGMDGKTQPIVIDRNLPQYRPTGPGVDIDEVLDFKTLPKNP